MKKRITPWWKEIYLTEQSLVDDVKIRLDNESIPYIAKFYNTNSTNIFNLMKKYNINRHVELRSKDWLMDHYINQQLSTDDIGKILNVSPQAVIWQLNKFQIPRRSRSQSQKIASSTKRIDSHLQLPVSNLKSRGYCIRYDNEWFSSAAELTVYISLKQNDFKFKFQPFTFNRKRPDFLIENQQVMEVKSGWDFNSIEHRTYLEWGNQMTNHFGYSYKLIEITKYLPKEYNQVLELLRGANATPGHTININHKIIFYNQY